MRHFRAYIGLIGLMVACSQSTIHKPPTTNEIRGVWITNIDSEVMFSPEALREGMAYLADRGFNVVFPVVWNEGYTLYPSEVMARSFGEAYRIDTVFAQAGWDPLAQLIIEAHKHGMEVMPWFEFGFSSSYNAGGGHILAQKPDWAAKDRDGRLLKKNGFEWMNPNHPDVQQLMLDLIEEVIRLYDIDGIQGDDRLPANPSEGGYDDLTRRLYREETGLDVPDDPRETRFLRWKSDKLSDFGGRLYRLVKDLDPELIVSLSPSVYPWSKDEYLQDYPEWIRRRQVDILHPQVYRYEIDRYKQTADDVALYSGLTDGSNTTTLVAPGILIKSGRNYNGPAYVREAMAHNRSLGMHGDVFFFYEGLREENQNLGDTLKATFYAEPAGLPYRKGEPRRFAALELSDETLRAPQTGRYGVYRIENGFTVRTGTLDLKRGDRINPTNHGATPASPIWIIIDRHTISRP
jgi:uncharacterized lipoprotein YddW (UPF0748 family)